jgi:hypothetical protein
MVYSLEFVLNVGMNCELGESLFHSHGLVIDNRLHRLNLFSAGFLHNNYTRKQITVLV